MKTVFEKIIDNELPSEKVFENERILVIKDIHPQAPIHLLIIAKKVIPNIAAITAEDLPLIGEIFLVAKDLAKKFHIEDGYRIITNNGQKAGQSVFHLHFHLVGGSFSERVV